MHRLIFLFVAEYDNGVKNVVSCRMGSCLFCRGHADRQGSRYRIGSDGECSMKIDNFFLFKMQFAWSVESSEDGPFRILLVANGISKTTSDIDIQPYGE